MFGAASADAILYSTPPTLAGLFFCLASAEGAGLFFLPGGVSATRKRLQWLFCRPCNYTVTEPKPFTRLYSGVSVDFTHFSAHNTAVTQAAYTPTTPRWRAYRQALHLRQYQIPPPRRTLYRPAQTAYYNNVYKGAPCTRRGGPAAEARRAGGTTGGLPPLLFSGFRPIANRGQK